MTKGSGPVLHAAPVHHRRARRELTSAGPVPETEKHTSAAPWNHADCFDPAALVLEPELHPAGEGCWRVSGGRMPGRWSAPWGDGGESTRQGPGNKVWPHSSAALFEPRRAIWGAHQRARPRARGRYAIESRRDRRAGGRSTNRGVVPLLRQPTWQPFLSSTSWVASKIEFAMRSWRPPPAAA